MRRIRFFFAAAALSALLVALLAGCPDVRVKADGTALEVGGVGLGGPATGNVSVELALNEGDVADYLSGGGTVTVSLHTATASRSATGGSTLVAGSEQKFDDPAAVVYTANGITVPNGDYQVEVAPEGGSVPESTKILLRMDVSVGDRKMTVGTATVPQLYYDLPQPADFWTSFTEEHDTDMTYEGEMGWHQTWGEEVQLAGTYRKDGFELEILKWSSGQMPDDDTAWEERAGGGTTYTVTQENYTPDGSPVVAVVSGGLGRDSTGIRLKLRREDGQYYAMRLRAVSYSGVSDWLYFPYLAMPVPAIVSTESTLPGECQNESWRDAGRWDISFVVKPTKYTQTNFMTWVRCDPSTEDSPPRTDPAWEVAREMFPNSARDTTFTGTSLMLPSFEKDYIFFFRLQARVDGVGVTPWFYHPHALKQKTP